MFCHSRFTDLAQTFPLHRGKGSRDPDELGGQTVGFFKGSVKMYPLPDDGSPEPERILVNIPPTGPVDVVVRVYVIRVSTRGGEGVSYCCFASGL